MKILFVIETIDNQNGTSVSARRFASELRRRGHEVKFLTTGIPDSNRFVVPELHLPLVNGLVKRHGFQYSKADEDVIREALEWCDIAHCFMPFGLEVATKRMADKFVVLMVGRLSPEKHQDIILEAVRHSAYESKIQVILVGTGLSEKKFRRKGKKLSNPPCIGYMSDRQLMNALGYADLYVHASKVELESLSCLEAMGSGLVPLISSSSQSATPQFALDSRSLFTPGKPRILAQKIDYWIEHPDARKEMERKYAELAKQYSITESVANFEKMLMEEIADHEKTIQKK